MIVFISSDQPGWHQRFQLQSHWTTSSFQHLISFTQTGCVLTCEEYNLAAPATSLQNPSAPPHPASGLVTRHDISVLSIFQRQRQSNCSRRNASETSLHQEMSARTNTDDCQTFDGEVISSVAVWSRSYCQHLDGRCHISRRTFIPFLISQKCTPNVRSVWRRRKMHKCLKLYRYINTLWPNLRPPHCDPFTELDLNCHDFYKTASFFAVHLPHYNTNN